MPCDERESQLQDFAPAFAHTAAAVCLAANDFYVPYVATVLQSIRNTSSDGHCYDIWILTTDITQRHQQQLRQIVDAPNFSLRFADVTPYAQQFQHIFVRGHFRIETYYRLLMQQLFPKYQKMAYIDSDLVVCHDIYELWATDVTDCLLAAVRDADTAGLYNGAEDGTGYSKRDYMDNVLKIRRPYDYFQAGVILFNLDEFRATFNVEDVILFAISDDWQLLDQDVLNYLAQGKVRFLDYRWNVMTDWKFLRIKTIISLAPADMQRDYLASRQDPWIIHYAGPDKPWDFPHADMADRFWSTCAQTPFALEATRRMLVNQAQSRLDRD